MSGYIGTQPVPQATQTRDSFTATSGQTSFATSGYTPNFLDVFLNGVKLAAADYTASNGSDVVLATGATTGDILEVVAYTTFDTANVTGAANFTVTGSFTSQGIDDNANATAITIDASENVGIGTSSPSELLEIKDGNMKFTNTVSNDSRIYFTHSTSANRRSYIGALETDGNGNSLIFAPNANGFDAVEAMRISGGNLLVGKTALSDTTAGISLESNGRFKAIRASNSGYFGRLTTDGPIVNFAKDGVTVGSIGATSGDLMIGTTDTGFRFLDGAEQIIPWNVTGNTNKDGVLDLGNSTNRFDNLYLSGGVFLGGTGAANKLDDYEEGTWTPSYPSGWTAESQFANYTKVGRFCYYNAKILVNVVGSGGFNIGGLPFTNGIYAKTHGGQMFEQVTLSTNRTQVVGFTSGNSNNHGLYQLHSAGSAWSSLTSSNLNSNSEFYIQGILVPS